MQFRATVCTERWNNITTLKLQTLISLNDLGTVKI